MSTSVRIVVAPNAFKGTLTANEAAHAMADGVGDTYRHADIVMRPVADGGDGTVAAALAAGFTRHEATVAGPLGTAVRAAFAVRADAAVLETAAASGLRLVPPGRLAPLAASTAGTGELVRAALDAGARRLLLGAGGSATTDGGAGMASALGVRFLDRTGRPLPPGGAALRDLHTIDVSGRDRRLAHAEITVAADVDSPLLGPHGAAAVFGPQKGAGPAEVAVLEEGLRTLANRLDALPWDVASLPAREARVTAGAGAAGGLGFGAMVFLGAQIRAGAELLLDLVDFDAALDGAHLVITGEGALDATTLRGKAPAVVASRARTAGVPVIAVCGRVDLDPGRWQDAGFTAVFTVHPVAPVAGAPATVGAPAFVGRAEAARRLRRATAEALRSMLS
ncbi:MULTISPECIES: glycerate kinase [unclassified Frankia]|uniref:glycerate kinase n=1 Tax=unclassified Frankia TaxID=2632575 RepID=UPI002AD27E82|nr:MULTISPECIES: glycerate kinase [unclassified Frankia]